MKKDCLFRKKFDPRQSDGCTLWPDSNYRHCCLKHDEAYFYGGDKEARYIADIEMMQCVLALGRPYMAIIMFIGVRLFAGPLWPHSARWGYSMPYCQSNTYRKSHRCRLK